MKLTIMTILIAFAVVAIFLIFSRIVKSRRSALYVESRLRELEKRFADLRSLFNEHSEYMRFSKFQLLQGQLMDLRNQVQRIKNFLLRRRIKEFINEIGAFEKELPLLREAVNERFFAQEKAKAKDVFSDKDGKDLLTDEQLKAVLCNDDRNLIIAGAGSGKTRVIDFKVRYLVNHKNVSPSKILLLSFSRKSANDLLRKVSENVSNVEARTIHSFASQISRDHGRKLFDDGRKELESFVIKALAKSLQDKGISSIFNAFYEKFFSDLKPLIFYKNLDDLRADLRKMNSKLIDVPDLFGEVKARRALKTLRGEYVRSVDERYIADFLYLQDVKYEYEKRYPQSEEWYYPDFYLPEYDVYLEHFAITDSGRPPVYFKNPQKYMDGIQWKRETHLKNKTKMIESYSYLLNSGETSLYLTDLLSKNGIEVRSHLESEEAYGKISREFCRIFTRFYHSFKTSGLSLEMLKQKYGEKKYLFFLQIFERFLRHFEEMVSAENKIDFNDMIIGAIARYKEESARKYDYVIVDEFQDTSNLAMKLLEEVYQSNPDATFISVGDDWQSIYGFGGSDVTILSDYSKKYSGVSVRNLNGNFRSHSRIVELGKRFISKNPAQIKKDVVSENRSFSESEIGFLSFEQMAEKIRTIPDNEQILVLYRYNDDAQVALDVLGEFFSLDKGRKPIRRSSCSKNISMMTIHASKGLEARHVFLIFPDGVRRKFPSEVEDHFIFNILKTNSDDFPFAEERRLMYVAITRAEQNLYFVSPNKDPNSIFWDELKELVRVG